MSPFSLVQLEQRLRFFLPAARLQAVRESADGNINQTWILQLAGTCSPPKAVLQRLNPAVFPDLPALMANFRRVTAHLAQCRAARPDTPEFPRLWQNPQGEDALFDEGGALWRLTTYIGPSRTLVRVSAPQAAAAGSLLARFHRLMQSLAPEELSDPLPGFQDTLAYLARFDAISAKRTPINAAEEFCLESIARLRPLACLLNEGQHARQVVHADPKCSNFLFAPATDQALSLIDLDTVRFGFLLHDLGDCLRSCCNPDGEDADNPRFDAEAFAALIRAWLAEGGQSLLLPDDREVLLDSARLLIFELGLRFFTDHLDGDRYFVCRFPGHNLQRAVTQFRLHTALMQEEGSLRSILAQRLKRLSSSPEA